MTLVPLTTCCLSLGIDPKTLRRWLQAAHLSCCPHPSDARLKCLTPAQLQHLAQLHGRPLLSAEAGITSQAVSARFADGSSEASAASSQAEETALSSQLAGLQQQVTTLQAQVTELTLALLALRSAQEAAPAPRVSLPAASAPTPTSEAVASSAVTPAVAKPVTPGAKQTRKRSRALPLIQVRPDGSAIVIAPTEGVVPLQPDSAEWFAWLASIEAFSFECPAGHYSATRKCRSGQRVQAWTLHCSLHGRSCGLYIGLTPTLTLARLLDMVQAVRIRLAVA
jgi:hypothetical protein